MKAVRTISVAVVAAIGSSQATVTARQAEVGYAAIIDSANRCVYDAGGNAQLGDCTENISAVRLGRGGFQNNKGLLRTDADPKTCLSASGDSVVFVECDGTYDESLEWEYTGANLLKFTSTNTCMTSQGTTLSMQACSTEDSQKYTFSVETYDKFKESSIEYTNLMNYGFCVTGGRKSVVYIRSNCEDSDKFHFFVDGDGSIRTADDRCLEIDVDFTDETSFGLRDCNTLEADTIFAFEYSDKGLKLAGTDKCLTADRLSNYGRSGYGLVTRTCDSMWPEQEWQF